MTLTHSLPFCYRSVRIRCNALLLQVGTVLLPSSWPDRSSWLKCSQHLFALWPSHFWRFRRDCNLRRGWLRAFDCSLLRLDTGSSSILDVSCPTCTAMRLEISILVSQQKARTTNSTQVGSQFSGHRFFRSWTAAATVLRILCHSMPLNAEKVHNGIRYSSALTCSYRKEKTHQIGTSHPSHANLHLNGSDFSLIGRLGLRLVASQLSQTMSVPGRKWALSAPRMPASCQKFSRRLRCAASLDRIKMYQVFLTVTTSKKTTKVKHSVTHVRLGPEQCLLMPLGHWSKHLNMCSQRKGHGVGMCWLLSSTRALSNCCCFNSQLQLKHPWNLSRPKPSNQNTHMTHMILIYASM